MSFSKNIETPTISKKEKIDLSYVNKLNTNIKPSNINKYIENSVILKEIFWNNFSDSFQDNIDFVKWAINKFKLNKNTEDLNQNEKLILENLNNIHKQALETTKILFNDMIKWFVPKHITFNNWVKKLWNNIPVLEENFYSNCSKQWENILKELYLLSFNYIISYYNWLWNIWIEFSKELSNKNQIQQNLQQKVNEVALKLNLTNSLEDIKLRQLLFLIWLNLDNKLFNKIVENIEKWRIKTFSSAIKKLLKSKKYRDQFNKEWILWDQLWFIWLFKNTNDLKNIAEELNKLYENWKMISKFNDRWVHKETESYDGNKDTLQKHPFVNIWFIINNLSLWELSLRSPYDRLIKNIIWNFNKNNNRELLFKELILGVDDLNHEIYKLSQDIKILRIVFIDNKNIKQWRNFNKSANKYITSKIEKIFTQIKTNINNLLNKEKININFSNLDDNLLKYIIYDFLEFKLKEVITDLAWENILEDIKKTKNYLDRKDTDKREYLKRLSLSFSKQLENEKEKKKKNSLSKYSQEIQNIYKKFKRKRNDIKKTAYFYNEIQKNKDSLKEIINEQIKAVTALAKTFK